MMGINPAARNVPFDFGIEALGEVVGVGSDVQDFVVGDIVLTAIPGNGYREYARISNRLALKVPAMKPEYLGLYISGAAAKVLVDHILNIQKGDIVMVTSALGSVGHYVVQLVKRLGHTVIGTCYNADEAHLLRDLNIDYAIVRSEENVAEVLASEFAGKLNVVVDALGGTVLEAVLEQTAPRARVVLIESLWQHLRRNMDSVHIDFYHLLIQRSVSLIGFNFGDYAQGFQFEALKLIDMHERGEITTVIDSREFIGINNVSNALTYLFTGMGRGKIIVKLVE
jgi:NADPH-dependent curcumin reductase CurA